MCRDSFTGIVFLFFALFFAPSLVFGQSATPQVGGACSQAGAFAGNQNSGSGPSGNLLVCNGTSWVRFMGYNTDGSIQITNVVTVGTSSGVDCGSATGGTMRYSPGLWGNPGFFVVCDGSNWVSIPSAGESGGDVEIETIPEGGPGCSVFGEVCDDGTIYAGMSHDGALPMFTTPCDTNQYWNGSSCVVLVGHWSGSGSGAIGTYGADVGMSWNDGSTNVATGYTSTTTGAANTAGLAGLAASYHAARYCANLVAYGHSDWYLPSRFELQQLAENQDAIGNFTKGTSANIYYRSATETGASSTSVISFFDNNTYNGDKNQTTRRVRCVRKG